LVRRLAAGSLVEAAAWLALALGAWVLSSGFDRPIEIYRFGAGGWPRAVIALIALVAICQLAGSAMDRPGGRAGQAAPVDAAGEAKGGAYWARLAAMLLLPLVYALSLDYTGFYVTTPLFLALYLTILGERRPAVIALVTLFITVLLLLVFTKLLYVGLPVGNWHPFYDISNAILVLLQ